MLHRFEPDKRWHRKDAGRLAARACLAGVLLAVLIGRAACAQAPIPPLGPGSFYLGGEGGWTALASHNASATIPGLGFRSDTRSWRGGFDVGARAGYAWGSLRLEEEFRYQQNDAQKFATHAATGAAAAVAIMTNAIYDIALGWPVTPHVGGGVGAVEVNDRATISGFGTPVEGSDWVVGYQAIAGFRWNIDAAMAVDLDYRYLATSTPDFRTAPDFVDSGIAAGNRRVTSGYQSHSLVASLLVRFGAP